MVVSLHSKMNDTSHVQQLCSHTLPQKKGLVHMWEVVIHKYYILKHWDRHCAERLHTLMFGSHISLRVFPTWGEFHLYSRTELWTKDNGCQHYCTNCNFLDVSFCGLYFVLLTEKASFSTKCAIPLGYFASCLDPEFTKTKNKKENTFYPLSRSCRQVDIIICITSLQLTSNCAELTKLVLGSNFEAIF